MYNIFKVNERFDIKKFIISIIVSLGTGMLSALLTIGTMQKYGQLQKPSFSPPAWIFGPVWTVLFILMGIASYRIWLLGFNKQEIKDSLLYYATQLVFNFLWTILFFRFDLRGFAFLDIIIMLVLITITLYKFFKLDKTAGYLMIPYLLWVAFASILNFSVWQLNK